MRFASGLGHAECIPEEEVGEIFRFEAENGDAIWWEKLAPSARTEDGKREDCNRTGVALSLVRRIGDAGEVILLPGDAAFGHVRHYRQLRDAAFTLTGVVAFHHGSGTHWTRATERLVRSWSRTPSSFTIAVSCADPNSYDHPDRERYARLFPNVELTTTAQCRANGEQYVDLRFASGS